MPILRVDLKWDVQTVLPAPRPCTLDAGRRAPVMPVTRTYPIYHQRFV